MIFEHLVSQALHKKKFKIGTFQKTSFTKKKRHKIGMKIHVKLVKMELHGKMKVDIFQHLGSKLPGKRPLLSILVIPTFDPPFKPFKI